ncbi:MAG: hypothetical protein LBJ62_10520 [Bifidobacteriaceae bacterium]|nr:hypothetical protein [Bifidobacteriaceae bacterium]
MHEGSRFEYTPAEPVALDQDSRLFAQGDVLWLPLLPNTRQATAADGYGVMAPPPVASDNASAGELARQMDALISQDVGLDSRVITLNGEWNRCMTARDFDLTSGNLYSRDNVSPWAAWTLALLTGLPERGEVQLGFMPGEVDEEASMAPLDGDELSLWGAV